MCVCVCVCVRVRHDACLLLQFKEGKITKFQPYSKYPPCYKDIAFWLPEGYEENDFAELVRITCLLL